MTKIMYVCDLCAENAPEMCGHYDVDELRVMPDGATLCEECYGDIGPKEFGVKDDDEGYMPFWSTFPKPLAQVPVDA